MNKGDNLFLIAKRFGVALNDLIAANPQIKNPNLIFPGDVVFIPEDRRDDRRRRDVRDDRDRRRRDDNDDY